MCTHILTLRIKVCQCFRNFMGDATHYKPFGFVSTDVNELHRHKLL